MRKLVRLKYTYGDNIVVHNTTFMWLVNQLASTNFPFDDALQALLLLSSLTNNCENLVVSLSASCQEENLSLQVVKTSILKEETRRKYTNALSQSEANVAQNLGRGRRKHRSPHDRDNSQARQVLIRSKCGTKPW